MGLLTTRMDAAATWRSMQVGYRLIANQRRRRTYLVAGDETGLRQRQQPVRQEEERN